MDDYEDEIVVKRDNPLLNKLKRLPGTTFRLPSRGLFYKGGEIDPDVENGEVVVHSMTAIDELMMKNPDMLFQGTAVRDVIARCVPQILQPFKLLVPDVDFLLTCLRKVSYGDSLTIPHTCRSCREKNDYVLPLTYFINNTKEITDETHKNMRISLGGIFDVRLKPCTYEQMVAVVQAGNSLNGDSSAQEMEDWVCKSLVAVCKSVDGTTDPDFIYEWAGLLPLPMRYELADRIKEVNQWGPEFSYKANCPSCKKETELVTSINPTNFFMQSSS